MLSDLIEARIKGWNYATEPDKYFEPIDAWHVRFKSSNHVYTLAYCCEEGSESGVWRCDCLLYTTLATIAAPAFCSHTIAVEKALPIPVPVRVQ